MPICLSFLACPSTLIARRIPVFPRTVPSICVRSCRQGASARVLRSAGCQEAGVAPEQVLARDLFLVNRQQPSVWGWRNEFISAPRLDDLGCAYISLAAFLTAGNDDAVSVFCCFDNEEVGSNTKQGAMSTFLRDCLERVNAGLGFTLGQLRCALAKSMRSAATTPTPCIQTIPELYDQGNRVMLNRGLAVNEAAEPEVLHRCL